MNDQFDKDLDRTFKFATAAAVVWGLLWLAIVGGIIYVAIHFITKFW